MKSKKRVFAAVVVLTVVFWLTSLEAGGQRPNLEAALKAAGKY